MSAVVDQRTSVEYNHPTANAYTLDPQKRYTNLEMYLHYLVRETVSAQHANATYKQL